VGKITHFPTLIAITFLKTATSTRRFPKAWYPQAVKEGSKKKEVTQEDRNEKRQGGRRMDGRGTKKGRAEGCKVIAPESRVP